MEESLEFGSFRQHWLVLVNLQGTGVDLHRLHSANFDHSVKGEHVLVVECEEVKS